MSRCALPFVLFLAIATVAQAASPHDEAPTTSAQVRSSVALSLGFIEKKGVGWLDSAKCIACHHGAWMVWSFNEAKEAGIAVDRKKLDAITMRVVGMYMKDVPNYQKKKNGWVESTYILMSQSYSPAADPASGEVSKVAHEIMLAGERADGSWQYAGQGLDRPDQENDEATTLWALIALPYSSKANTPEAATRDKALAWLKNVKQAPGLDSLALRLAVETRYGDPARAAALKDELISRQNPDGGWSWSAKRPSEAFGTGEGLYVLSLAGVKNDAPAIQKAWKFLVSTQAPDGSWHCNSRKPTGGDKISTYWGTSWAVIGLSRSLGATERNEVAQPSAAR